MAPTVLPILIITATTVLTTATTTATAITLKATSIQPAYRRNLSAVATTLTGIWNVTAVESIS